MTEFAEAQRERSKKFILSKQQEHLLPLEEIPSAIARLNLQNPLLEKLALQLSQGNTDALSGVPLVTNAEGATCIDMAVFADAKNTGGELGELFIALDRDMVLRGEFSVSAAEFQGARKEMTKAVYEDLSTYYRHQQDVSYRLASEECAEPFEKQEDKERFEQMRACAQAITDKLFIASGIKHYVPRVVLTRSNEVNAFVFGIDTGKMIRESMIESLSKEEKAELPIFIHTGLIAKLENQDQLAGVLAHEFSHLLQPSYNESTGGRSDELSKRLEYGADATGMQMADAAGFNPRGIIEVFRSFPNEHSMQILFGRSHPATEDRVIELEKLFHRTDVPFSNAQKTASSFDPEMHAVAKEMVERKMDKPKFLGTEMREAEKEGRLEQFVANTESTEALLSTDNIHELESLIERRRFEACTSHEYQKGESGQSTFLSELLHYMVSVYQQQGTGKKINGGNEWNYYFPEMKQENLLSPMEDPSNYLESEWGEKKIQMEHYRKWYFGSMREMGLVSPDQLNTLTAWTDSSKPEAVILWEMIETKLGRTFSPEEKEQYLYALLRGMMKSSRDTEFKGNSVKFGISKQIETTRTVTRTRVVPHAEILEEDSGHLSKLSALAGRVQVKKTQRQQEEVEEYEEVISSFHYQQMLESASLPANIDFSPKLFTIGETTKGFQDTIDQYAKKSRDVLQAHLRERGIAEVADQDLDFLLRSEVSYTPFDREPLNLTRIETLLRIVETPRSLENLFRNAEGTTRKDEYGNPPRKWFNQGALLADLLRLGAFGFDTKTEEEIAFQQKCLKRIELDPIFYVHSPLHLGRDPLDQPNEYSEYIELEDKDIVQTDLKEPKRCMPNLDFKRVAAQKRLAPLFGKYANAIIGKPSQDAVTQLISEPQDFLHANALSDEQMKKYVTETNVIGLNDLALRYVRGVRGLAREYLSQGVLLPEGVLTDFHDIVSGYQDPCFFQPTIDLVVKEYLQGEKGDGAEKEEFSKVLDTWLKELGKKAFHGKEMIYLSNLLTKYQRDSKGERSRIDNALGTRMDWLAYRDPVAGSFYESRFLGQLKPEENKLENDRFLEIVSTEAQKDGKKAKILAFVQDWQLKGKPMGPMMRAVCMGTFVPFINYGEELPFADIVSLWRTVGDVYKEEWKNIEAYKSLDQQLSHWEWNNHNPLLPFGLDKKGKRNRLQETLNFFDDKNGAYEAKKVYQIDTKNLDGVLFSWPLFLEDVMKDQVTFSYEFTYQDKKFQEEYKLAIQNLKREITKLIKSRDPKVTETILSMQPGFFKEFLLKSRIKPSALKTLDQVEAWLPHFSSRPHEGTERNQITSQIESNKQKITEETKKELMKQAMRELGFPEDMIQTAEISLDLTNSLTGKECSVRLPSYEYSSSYIWNDTQEKREERYQIYQRYLKAIHKTYKILLRKMQRDVRNAGHAHEGDVRVFSDQIVEDEKNKLHIGPAYRLRMVSQPLMDWHSRALEQTKTAADTEKLLARVDTSLPEKHPLKDIFVKNNLMMELWQSILSSIGKEKAASLGISLEKKQINLDEVLDKLPLYKEVSFLKSYSLFELSGIEDAISLLPKELAKQIRDRIELTMSSQISADQYEGVRRMLMELEKRTVWPELKAKRKGHPEVFDAYIARITGLYDEPSYARDEILESIGMDLATTPDQIKQVWGLRYDEQMRLPTDKDSKETKGQFHALEKMKAGLSFADTKQRAEYLIWFLGGEAPLAETFTSDKMNISLLDRKDLFWSLGTVERKSFLYDLLLGNNGVMQLDPERRPATYGSYDDRKTLTDDSTEAELAEYRGIRDADPLFPKWERPSDMIRYVADEVFEQMFGNQSIDAKLPAEHETNVKGKELIQTIFRELFVQQKEPARRAELFSNIIEAIGAAKRDNVELSPGKLIKLLLEQVGVVGIKAGQVLSEQPDLLPESIRQELAGLKDQTTPFSKRGMLSYLEAAGVVQGSESRLSIIGDVIGSASIKQVLDGTMEGKRVAIKGRRPSIDKNFEEDLAVLGRVFKKVEAAGFELPTYLLGEVERLSRDELSFAHEVDHQRAFEASLKKRDAHIGLETSDGHRELPLTVAEVYVPPNTTEEDIGLIVEEFVRGFSLKELYGYRSALRSGNETELKKFRDKTERIYNDPSLEPMLEQRIVDMNLERFQADLGVEILQQIQDGVIHSDLHSGNIYVDPHPLEGRAILIDLGSVGYSEKSMMPEYLQAETEDGFDAKSDFRDFLTAFFGENLRFDVIATVVNKYTSREWSETDVRDIVGDVTETDGKVNKIFYALLKGGAEMHSQFRYLLKAIATGAGHLDQLKRVASTEMALEEPPEYSVVKTLFDKGLINVEMLVG